EGALQDALAGHDAQDLRRRSGFAHGLLERYRIVVSPLPFEGRGTELGPGPGVGVLLSRRAGQSGPGGLESCPVPFEQFLPLEEERLEVIAANACIPSCLATRMLVLKLQVERIGDFLLKHIVQWHPTVMLAVAGPAAPWVPHAAIAGITRVCGNAVIGEFD